MKTDEKTWEVRLNVGGDSIMTSRTTEDAAKKIASAFGIEWNGDNIVHWPITINKVGKRAELERDALGNLLASRLVVPDNQIVFIITAGKEKTDCVDCRATIDETFQDCYNLAKLHDVNRCTLDIGRAGMNLYQVLLTDKKQ